LLQSEKLTFKKHTQHRSVGKSSWTMMSLLHLGI